MTTIYIPLFDNLENMVDDDPDIIKNLKNIKYLISNKIDYSIDTMYRLKQNPSIVGNSICITYDDLNAEQVHEILDNKNIDKTNLYVVEQ